MCWSETTSVVMVGIGAAATVVTAYRGEPRAIPATLGFFTLMEALQVAGYWSVNDCQSDLNRSVTLLSWVHISLQPIFINAFAMSLAPREVPPELRRWVLGLASLATLLLLARMVPFGWAGQCAPGDTLCGPAYCTVSGNWHIAWEMPLNDMWGRISPGLSALVPFPAYLLSVFALPLVYGAWRFVTFHALCGPFLASLLTDNPNEMPAIWCLFSIGLVLFALSPALRGRVLASARHAGA